MTTLAEIRDRIQAMRVEGYYEASDIVRILDMMQELVDETERIEERVRDLERRFE